MRLFFLILWVGMMSDVFAQSEASKYWVMFTDKDNSTYSIDYPEDFLTPKAVARRVLHHIPIAETDLPVNKHYINTIQVLGVKTHHASRWFNALVIETAEEEKLNVIQQLSFVSEIVEVSKVRRKYAWSSKKNFSMKEELEEEKDGDIFYGSAFNQLQMVNGDILHAYGYTGKGITIGVMDAGFSGVLTNSVFRSLFDNGQILGTFDFVEGDEDVYGSSSHGAQVFSIMGANQPGYYVGAAPDANYWLFRTEDGATESTVEESNWIAAAEFADSVGADIITTSLGYSVFDDPETNYTYEDMDGNTTIITRGADMAAAKGMLVISSAGNQGNKPWKYVTAPADGDSVLAVGSVNSEGIYSSFSSQGPTADGRVKPNVAAQGTTTAFVNTDGTLGSANGTSYAAPLVAGLAACLWQADRSKNNMAVLHAIEQSASQYEFPDEQLGYGIPNFNIALFKLTNFPLENFNEETAAFVYPNPSADEFNVYYHARETESLTVTAYNVAGELLETLYVDVNAGMPYRFSFNRLNDYPKGVYIIKINSENYPKVLKAVRIAH